MGPECSLVFVQEPTTGSFSEPDESNPHPQHSKLPIMQFSPSSCYVLFPQHPTPLEGLESSE
jgi:hypothetical protein